MRVCVWASLFVYILCVFLFSFLPTFMTLGLRHWGVSTDKDAGMQLFINSALSPPPGGIPLYCLKVDQRAHNNYKKSWLLDLVVVIALCVVTTVYAMS